MVTFSAKSTVCSIAQNVTRWAFIQQSQRNARILSHEVGGLHYISGDLPFRLKPERIFQYSSWRLHGACGASDRC